MAIDFLATTVDNLTKVINIKKGIKMTDGKESQAGNPEDPMTLRAGEQGYVQDKEEARSRATVEDGDRTGAVKNRTAELALRNFPAEHEEKMQAINATRPYPEVTSHFPGKKRREQQAARLDAQRQNRLKIEDMSEHEQATRTALIEGDFGVVEADRATIDALDAGTTEPVFSGYSERHERHLGNLERLKEMAEERDRRADMMGDWAGFLHNSPPSEAFRASNSLLYAYDRPYELWDIEANLLNQRMKYVEQARREVEKLEHQPPKNLESAEDIIDEVAENYSIDLEPDPEDDHFPAHFAAESRALAQSLVEQVKTAYDDHMTVAQIKQRAVDLSRLKLELEESEVRAMERALNDIKNGKAADPNYSVETGSDDEVEPSATQPHPWRQTDRGIDLGGIGERLGFEEPGEDDSPAEG